MSLFLIMLIALICPSQVLADSYQPGFRTIGLREEDPPLRLDLNIWYPTRRAPRDLNYPPWSINAAPGAKIADGCFPLLVLSHASSADRFAYHATAANLAKKGFIIVAPTHSRDYMLNMDDLFSWQQLSQRINDINSAIDYIINNNEFAQATDSERIGLIGFGSGATAALLLGGALPDCENWPEYCGKAGASDPYCQPWARDRINQLCQSLPLAKSLANTSIKAIAAVAPGFGMLFHSSSFKYFHTPLLLVATGKDAFNRAHLHSGALASALGPKARLLDLPFADAQALISPCAPALAEELPELCLSLAPTRKKAALEKLDSTLFAFFSHYLLVKENLPHIPEAPDLTPPPPQPAPLAPLKKGKTRSR